MTLSGYWSVWFPPQFFLKQNKTHVSGLKLGVFALAPIKIVIDTYGDPVVPFLSFSF